MDEDGDNVLPVPHSKYAVVAKPFGLTNPLSIPEVDVTPDAAVDIAEGAGVDDDKIVKRPSLISLYVGLLASLIFTLQFIDEVFGTIQA